MCRGGFPLASTIPGSARTGLRAFAQCGAGGSLGCGFQAESSLDQFIMMMFLVSTAEQMLHLSDVLLEGRALRWHRRWEALLCSQSHWSCGVSCIHAGVSCGVLAKSHSGTSPTLAVYLLKITSVLLIAGVVPHFPSIAADLCINGWLTPAASLPCCSRAWPRHPYMCSLWHPLGISSSPLHRAGRELPHTVRQEMTETQGEVAAGLPMVSEHCKCI